MESARTDLRGEEGEKVGGYWIEDGGLGTAGEIGVVFATSDAEQKGFT